MCPCSQSCAFTLCSPRFHAYFKTECLAVHAGKSTCTLLCRNSIYINLAFYCKYAFDRPVNVFTGTTFMGFGYTTCSCITIQPCNFDNGVFQCDLSTPTPRISTPHSYRNWMHATGARCISLDKCLLVYLYCMQIDVILDACRTSISGAATAIHATPRNLCF